jgi:hypothetical protein
VLYAFIGCFSLLLRYGGGLYWLVPTIFICLVWGLLASWQLIVMLPEEDKGTGLRNQRRSGDGDSSVQISSRDKQSILAIFSLTF